MNIVRRTTSIEINLRRAFSLMKFFKDNEEEQKTVKKTFNFCLSFISGNKVDEVAKDFAPGSSTRSKYFLI